MINIKVDYGGIDEEMRRAEKQLNAEVINTLTNIGEMYISEARTNGNYTDQTGNLRNAHSYIVYHNGERAAGYIGRPETLQKFEQMKRNDGWQFIVGDGMDYTSYVEGRGYDVCTSAFALVERLIREKFKAA